MHCDLDTRHDTAGHPCSTHPPDSHHDLDIELFPHPGPQMAHIPRIHCRSFRPCSRHPPRIRYRTRPPDNWSRRDTEPSQNTPVCNAPRRSAHRLHIRRPPRRHGRRCRRDTAPPPSTGHHDYNLERSDHLHRRSQRDRIENFPCRLGWPDRPISERRSADTNRMGESSSTLQASATRGQGVASFTAILNALRLRGWRTSRRRTISP